jgi:ElaB/YqjD/DUF883 family membrane-anchored ribosome-binding protein
MFNLNKTPETNTSEIKENFNQLVDTTKGNISEVAKDVKQSASKLGSKVQEKGNETKQDALELIESLKALLAQNTESANAEHIKDQITNKVGEWKSLIQHEVANAVETSKAQTTRALREQPFMSLAVAIGAGIVIGYVLGNSQSSK